MCKEEFSQIPGKTDDLLWPSMTFEVILIKMKYLRIHNICTYKFYQNLFTNSRKERRKDGVFLWDVEELTFLITYMKYIYQKF